MLYRLEAPFFRTFDLSEGMKKQIIVTPKTQIAAMIKICQTVFQNQLKIK